MAEQTNDRRDMVVAGANKQWFKVSKNGIEQFSIT